MDTRNLIFKYGVHMPIPEGVNCHGSWIGG